MARKDEDAGSMLSVGGVVGDDEEAEERVGSDGASSEVARASRLSASR